MSGVHVTRKGSRVRLPPSPFFALQKTEKSRRRNIVSTADSPPFFGKAKKWRDLAKNPKGFLADPPQGKPCIMFIFF